MRRVFSPRVVPIQSDCLIRDDAGRAIGRGGINTVCIEVGFRARHEESAGLVQTIQAGEIDVPAIHDLNGARFGHDHLECVPIVQLDVGDVNEAWDVAAQIQRGVHFHGGLRRPEMLPWER